MADTNMHLSHQSAYFYSLEIGQSMMVLSKFSRKSNISQWFTKF